jgi:hypothetical protein
MNKRKIQWISIAALMMLGTTAIADEVNGLIQNLSVVPGKDASIKLYNSNSACGAIAWHLNLSDANNQDTYQNLLGAFATGKKILLETENNCSGKIVSAKVDQTLEFTQRAEYNPRFQWLSNQTPNLSSMKLTPLIEQYLIEQFSSTHTWDGITAAQFDCSKEYLDKTLKESPNVKDLHIDPGYSGKISYTVTEPPYIKGKYLFNFELVAPKLKVEIVQKPSQVPNDSIWSSIDEGLQYCKG